MRDDTASAAIRVTIAYDRRLWRRAMTGWWQSVVPPVPFVKRALFWAIVWFLVGISAVAVAAAGYSLFYIGAGLAGAALMLAGFAYLQNTRMGRFWDVIGTHWDRAGETEAVFDPTGVTLTDAVSRRDLRWAAIDAVRGQRGVTVLRSGISMIAVPDSTLPEGLTPPAFRAQLAAWREAG